MADQRFRYTTEPLILRSESGQLILPEQIASEIKNFVSTPQGTLTSIEGPTPYVPRADADKGITFSPDVIKAFEYTGKITGIFHALLMRRSRDILLIQDGDEIKVHQGWKTGTINAWKTLIGPASSSPDIEVNLSTDGQPAFPCQFEATPTGIIIVPQPYERAYFYDGDTILPLGYNTTPSPPTGYGPETVNPAAGYNKTNGLGPNESGYSVDQLGTGNKGIFKDYGMGRIGTFQYQEASTTDEGGDRILKGIWQGAVQWIDYFGNLSPISARSNEISVDMQAVGHYKEDSAITGELIAVTVDQLGKTFAWANIDTGPEGTVGRNFLRTRDQVNSGTAKLFHVSGNVGAGAAISAFATIPDNISNRLPDNIPDSWLLTEPRDVQAVPLFKLCKTAFGRLWVGNTYSDPGLLMYSIPGRYGTFESGSVMYPDPNGNELTGLWTVPEGLLAMTESSAYLIARSNDGRGFRAATLSTTVGCIAPSSFGTMNDGSVIWLSRDGFYSYKEGSLTHISKIIHPTIQRINWGRALRACAAVDSRSQEYRCWLPIDGAEDNVLALVWDGVGWRRRKHERLHCVCVTRDHRRYMLGGGKAEIFTETASQFNDASLATSTEGVWLLDHGVEDAQAAFPIARLETSWISWMKSKEKRSVKTIYIAFRETYEGSVTIKVYRDWRERSTPIYSDTTSGTLVLEEDLPALWDTTRWDESDAEYTARRPYWKRIDIDIPSCEVYKIVIIATNRVEFIGMTIDEEPKLGGFGSRIS
ncbi:hypothetical protein CMI37_32305 [Candidatus Pacearchaeota archaeon]|nr:hypothetical protein [Candidatus Pacearchaeota archaeon]